MFKNGNFYSVVISFDFYFHAPYMRAI